MNLQMFKLDLGRGTRDQIANIHWIIEKTRECQKKNQTNIYFCFVDYAKAFVSEQCKEIEENNRMGKTRVLFKKIRDTKGTFRAKMGTMKDRNSEDRREAENIKKRWQEYTEELYKKNS